MSIYSELREQIDTFSEIRTRLLDGPLPSPPELDTDDLDIEISFGPPPYVVDDGSSNYAVVLENDEIHPLPFGYELDDDQLNLADGQALYTWLSGSGLATARLVPVLSDFELPEPATFEIEDIADSEAWSVADQVTETLLDSVGENIRRELGPLLLRIANQVKEEYDEIDSIDEALGATLQQSGFFARIFALSLQEIAASALEEIDEEIDEDAEES